MSIESQSEMDAIDAELMDDGDGFEGRQDTPEQPQEFLGGAQCGELCGMVFGIVAARKGEQWNLRPEEKTALGGSVDIVLAKYIPTNAEAYGPEIGLMVAAVAIIMPRMQGEEVASGSA